MDEYISFLFQQISSGKIPKMAMAMFYLALTVSAIAAAVHGLDGRCEVKKFDINDAADYGCSGGLFLRGLFENVPVSDSVKKTAP